jgi:hypothetical protein
MIDPQTMAMLGITDPSKALDKLGLYAGAKQAADTGKAEAEGQPATGQQDFNALWAAKYGPQGGAVKGVMNDFGQETFPLPETIPTTINDPFLGPQYNPEIGEVLGFDDNGRPMTTKTHPYLRSLARLGSGSAPGWAGQSSGGDEVGGGPDGSGGSEY